LILVDDHLIAHRLAAGGLGRGESTVVATTCRGGGASSPPWPASGAVRSPVTSPVWSLVHGRRWNGPSPPGAEVLGADLVLRQDTPKIRTTATARSITYRLDS